MRSEFDAIIIGAGPAGSSAAILLARAGWAVVLVEKQPFPRRKVCGECVAASNLPLLDALGIGAAFDAAAGPELRSIVLMRGADAVQADLPAADPRRARHPWGRALGRETLDTLLLDEARRAGATVLQPWAAQAIEGSVGAWRCRVRSIEADSGAVLCAPVMIAAHGSWELLPQERERRRLARKASDLFAFKANFRGTSLREGLLPVLAFEGGYGGMVVADDGVTTLACCIRADRLDAARRAARGARAGDAVEALLKRECAGVREVLTGASRDDGWLAAGPIDPGVRLRADDTVFRIGNAAGEAHPIIGEGISMALQSAWLLCGQLLAGTGSQGPGDADWQRARARAYAALWRNRFAPRLRLAAAFAHIAMRPGLSAALVSAARSWPGLLTRGATWGGKVRTIAAPGATAAALPGVADRLQPQALSPRTRS